VVAVMAVGGGRRERAGTLYPGSCSLEEHPVRLYKERCHAHVRFGSLADSFRRIIRCLLCLRKQTFRSLPEAYIASRASANKGRGDE
jgi:hypothetical protein